jgi:hypothetical protein
MEQFQYTAVEKSKLARRQFLDEFATSNGFNPMNAEEWYFITWKHIMSAVSLSLFISFLQVSHFFFRVRMHF